MGQVLLACWKAVLSAGTATAESLESSRAYSAERLFALDEYRRSTSRWHVLLVPVLYPVPALLLLFAVDAIPLQDPREGWRANVSFWARMVVCSVATTWVVLLEVQLVVPEMNFSTKRQIVITAAVSAAYTLTLMALADLWRFPIPFIFAFGTVPFSGFLNLFVVGSLGVADQNLLRRYFKFAFFVGLEGSMLVVYPAYNEVFLSLEGVPQLAFVLLLPMIKISFKYLTTKLQSSDDDEDLIPGLHSSVDIFDALYMTKCMQSAGTLVVAFAIIVLDIMQSYVAIYLLAKQTRHLHAVSSSTATDSQSSIDLLSLVLGLLNQAQQLDGRQSLRFGTRRLLLSKHSETELSRLRSIRATVSSQLANTKLSAVHPSESTPSTLIPAAPQPDIIRETTRLLHESETVVVVEYIEAAVPFLYAIYISILFHLPNAKYYQDMQHMTKEKLHRTVVNILIYAGMELLSLVYVYGILKGKFGLSVFSQLAFALEKDWRIYQCNFVIWTLIAFQFLLIHCGCDFTFKFQYLD